MMVWTQEFNQQSQLLAYIFNMFLCVSLTLQMCCTCVMCEAPGGSGSEENHSSYALNCSYFQEFGERSDAVM